MPFVDTHAHLHFPEYAADREAVIERARASGVTHMINVGTDPASSKASLELTRAHDFIFASAGIHPHDAKDATPEAMKKIESLLKDPRMVAIGEVGLDYFREHSPHAKQREVLTDFFKLHQKIGKPLILHCRDAYADLLQMMKDELKAPVRAVMHCFSSDKDMMKSFLDLGCMISFAGPLTYKKNDVLREACKACPLDRLVLETDAPFLPPQSSRGKRNESSYLLETAGVAAGLHGISVEELGRRTTANAQKLFGLC